MGARYWVGVSGSWNAIPGAKWSLTSGGVGGAAVPTAADDVFFDANSGAVNVSALNTPSCKNLDCTGFTGTLNFNNQGLNFYGSIALGAAMTFAPSDAVLTAKATSAGQTIKSNGTAWGFSSSGVLIFDGAGGAWTLLDDLDLGDNGGALVLVNGALDDGGKDVNARRFSSTLNGARSLTLGAGTFSILGSTSFNLWTVSGSNFALTADPAHTLKISCGGSAKIFNGGGFSYGNLWVTGTHGLSFNDAGNDAGIGFNDLKIDASNAVTFRAGAPFNLATFSPQGGSGTEVVLASSVPGTQYTLNKTGGGTISVDYLNVTDCNGTPAATWWVGHNSIDGGGNTGLAFADVFNASRAEAGAASDTTTSAQASDASAAEALAAVEVSSGMAVDSASIAEAGAAVEAASGAKSTDAAIAEAGAVAEDQDSAITQEVAAAEVIVPAEINSAASTLEVAAAEAGAAMELESANASLPVSIAEALAAAETESASASLSGAVAEAGAAASVQSATNGATASVDEVAAATAAGSSVITTAAVVAESGLAVEAASVIKEIPVSASEQGAAAEASTAAEVAVAAIAENANAVEAQSGAAAFSGVVTEAGAAVAIQSGMDVLGSSVAEQGAAAATQSASADMVAAVSEQRYLYDVPSARSLLAATVAESAAATSSNSSTLRPPNGSASARVARWNSATARIQPL